MFEGVHQYFPDIVPLHWKCCILIFGKTLKSPKVISSSTVSLGKTALNILNKSNPVRISRFIAFITKDYPINVKLSGDRIEFYVMSIG